MNKFKKILFSVFFISILFVSLLTPALGVNGGYQVFPKPTTDHPDWHVQQWDKTTDDIDWSVAPKALKNVLDSEYWSYSESNSLLDYNRNHREYPFILVVVTSNSYANVFFGFNCAFGDFVYYESTPSVTSFAYYNGLGFCSSISNTYVSSLSSVTYNFNTNTFSGYQQNRFNSDYSYTDSSGNAHGPVYRYKIYSNSDEQMNFNRDFYYYGSNVNQVGDFDLLYNTDNLDYIYRHTTYYISVSGDTTTRHQIIYYPSVNGSVSKLGSYGQGSGSGVSFTSDHCPNYFFSTFVPKYKGAFDEVLDPNNYSTTPPTTNPAVSDYNEIESELNQYGDYGYDSLDSYVTRFSGADGINSNFWESFSWIKELALQVVDPNAPAGHGLRFIYIAVTFILLLGIISFVLGLARRG